MADKNAKGQKGALEIAELTNTLVDPILAKKPE